jgi:hypothetical protein
MSSLTRTSWASVRPMVNPLDLVFFNGPHVSKAIRTLQKRKISKAKRKARKGLNEEEILGWSHVALVITSDIVDDARLKPGKLYVLESTMSGDKNDGVNSIEGHAFFGVQIRDLDELVAAYTHLGDDSHDVGISFAEQRHHSWNDTGARDRLRITMTSWIHHWEGTRYDWNIISLGGSMFPALRPLRNAFEKVFNTDGWLFCSELVFTVLQILGQYDEGFDPRNVLPMDLIGYDTDVPAVPKIYSTPVVLEHF